MTFIICNCCHAQGGNHEDNIIISIVKRGDPFGVARFFKETLAPGLRSFEIQTGYMEVPDVEEVLREAGIQEKTIFYGVEDIFAEQYRLAAFLDHQTSYPEHRPILQAPVQQAPRRGDQSGDVMYDCGLRIADCGMKIYSDF
jgi:K+ transporter